MSILFINVTNFIGGGYNICILRILKFIIVCYVCCITFVMKHSRPYGRGWDPVKPVLLTVPVRYFCCGSLMLLVLAVRIYSLVHLLCE